MTPFEVVGLFYRSHNDSWEFKSMQFSRADVDIFVHKSFRKLYPDEILPMTTHMVIGAHQDDIEIMAFHAIQECFKSKTNWLTGVTLTDGRGSPRTGSFKKFTDKKMVETRRKEQRKAAELGQYLCQLQFPFMSDEVKTGNEDVTNDLEILFQVARPKYVYLHNLADKHQTHVASAIRALTALRRLQGSWMPEKVFGCEVWRSLDWMVDGEKVVLPESKNSLLRQKLIKVFRSQVVGGKRYDQGVEGRRRANATFFESHKVDKESHISFAMDLTPLIREPAMDPREFVRKKLDGMKAEVLSTLERFV